MKQQRHPARKITLLAIMALLLPNMAMAFDSGSTGADGEFNPQVDTELQLPADGIFNFTTVTIPSGVIVTFAKNVINTPVTILASGDITIGGNIYLFGKNATHVGAIGDGNIGDDGLPGVGGPGGFDGGAGGLVSGGRGGQGLGPGGGIGGIISSTIKCGGGGGGYSGGGSNATCGVTPSLGGSSYGSVTLLPLIGGSGGGGGSAGNVFTGSGGGGGGGGGAILLASSGTIAVNGKIYAYGGLSGNTSRTNNDNGSGGGGSGGAIRIIATTISGNGEINANGAAVSGSSSFRWELGGNGASGRIRLESETFLRTAATTPAYSFAQPGDIFVAGLPSLLITHVAGVAAPAVPTGSADIVLPENTINPVLVRFATSGVPVGNTVKLTLTPPNGATTSAISNALAGSDTAATADTSIDLPDGPSIMSASVSFTVTAEDSIALSTFTKGEKVATVMINAIPGQGSTTILTTVSGKQYTMASNVAAM